MRNNEERFGPPIMEDQSSHVHGNAESLSFVTPTEMVELPSKGKLYPPHHPLHNKQEVEIKFMTAKEEDLLTNKSLLRKGVAIDKMLQSLLVDRSLKVEDLLLGDKNAILLASRITAYGSEYAIQVTCPSCETKQKHQFDLTEIVEKHVEEKQLPEGVVPTGNGTFMFVLPRLKTRVEFRLLTSRDEAEMTKQLITKKDIENTATAQLKKIIVSVNGIHDHNSINTLADNMVAYDARALRNAVKETTPEIDMKQEFSCESCGHTEEMEVPLTAEFFWPK